MVAPLSVVAGSRDPRLSQVSLCGDGRFVAMYVAMQHFDEIGLA